MVTQQKKPRSQVTGRWQGLEPWPLPSLNGVEIEGKSLLLKYGKSLVYRHSPARQNGWSGAELASASHEMLLDFANLNGDNQRLLTFAMRYGALGLCTKHGWPLAHSRPYCPATCKEVKTGETRREPLAQWYEFSELASAILIALGNDGDKARALAKIRAYGTNHPQAAIYNWLAGADLRVGFTGRPLRLLLYGIPPLWAALGLQMASIAVKAKRVALCTHCLRLFTPDRESPRSFCPICKRTKADVRNLYAVRDRRERIRTVLQLYRKGQSVDEIVKATGLSTQQVKKYLATVAPKGASG